MSGLCALSRIASSRSSRSLPVVGRIAAPSQDLTTHFSTLSLRRPPSRAANPKGARKDGILKWRAHAVPLNLGNYVDVHQSDRMADGRKEEDAMSHMDKSDAMLLEAYKKEQEELKAKKERWLKNAEPPKRVSIIDDGGRSHGRGTRKTAHAGVFIHPGFGNVVVNGMDVVDYFGRESDRDHLLTPLVATGTCGRFDVVAQTSGGGLRGQAGAIRLGIARALNHYNPDEYRPPLKRLGLLARDPRMVERKKVGRVKARKRPQWVRR